MSSPAPPPACVALSGSAGTGKTTLARALAARLGWVYVDEGMRRRLEAGLDLHTLSRAGLRDLTEALLGELVDSVTGALDRGRGVVSERAPVDFAAFWLHYRLASVEDAATERFFARVRAAQRRFDRVVVLPWGAIALAADGIRSPDRWIQLHYQAALEGLARRFVPRRALLWLPERVTAPPERVRWVLDRLPPGRGRRRGQ